MLFDLKDGTFLHYYQSGAVRIVDKDTFHIYSTTTMPWSIQWFFMFEGKLSFINKRSVIQTVDDSVKYGFAKSCLIPRQKGLIMLDKKYKCIGRFDPETKQVVGLRGWAKRKNFSRDGELMFGENGLVQDKDRKSLCRFEDFQIYDGRLYKGKPIISARKGIWYDGYYITNVCVEYDILVIGNHLYWFENRNSFTPIYKKYCLLRPTKIVVYKDTFFDFKNF